MGNSVLSPIVVPHHTRSSLHSLQSFFHRLPPGGNTGDLLSYFPGLDQHSLPGHMEPSRDRQRATRLYARTKHPPPRCNSGALHNQAPGKPENNPEHTPQGVYTSLPPARGQRRYQKENRPARGRYKSSDNERFNAST